MKLRLLSLFVGTALLLGSCNSAEKRTDGTAGEPVSNIDSAAAEGGVKADATVIDNDAGPTVSADADSTASTDGATTR